VNPQVVNGQAKDFGTVGSFSTVRKPEARIEYADPSIQAGPVLSIDDVYPITEALNPELSAALRLLREGLLRVGEALTAGRKGDRIAADDAMQRLQALLPELFCCRTLGDGFGTVINAISSSFENLSGQTPSKLQIEAIFRTLQNVREEPFMGVDAATELVMALEAADLSVEPPEFEYLVDWLDGRG
jgi:hypothetical protein